MKIQLALIFAIIAVAHSLDLSHYKDLIEKFGVKAEHFLQCMGKDWVAHCEAPTLECLKAHDVPGCVELIKCEGKDAKDCAGKLKNEGQTYLDLSHYKDLIEKFGVKAVHFLECMGKDWVKDCTAPTLECLKEKDVPGCVELIKCEGKDAKDCAGKLKNEGQTYLDLSHYKDLIEKFGVKAVHFLECMGKDWVKDCTAPTLECLKEKDVPGCVELIKCEGKDAKDCAGKLKNEGQTYGLLDKVKVSKKYVKFIEKYGTKAWHFLECMGLDWALHCSGPTLGCLGAKNVIGCISLVACEGKDAKSCSGKLH